MRELGLSTNHYIVHRCLFNRLRIVVRYYIFGWPKYGFGFKYVFILWTIKVRESTIFCTLINTLVWRVRLQCENYFEVNLNCLIQILFVYFLILSLYILNTKHSKIILNVLIIQQCTILRFDDFDSKWFIIIYVEIKFCIDFKFFINQYHEHLYELKIV